MPEIKGERRQQIKDHVAKNPGRYNTLLALDCDVSEGFILTIRRELGLPCAKDYLESIKPKCPGLAHRDVVSMRWV
jgi:hypothetical protein